MVNFTAEKCAVLNVLMKMSMVMVTINQAYTVRYRQCNIQNYFVHKNCSTISTEILNLHLWNDDSLKVTKTKLRPVLTKWATSRQGTKGDMAHWTFQKSIKNKGISQGNNGLWTPNMAATLAYYISF